DPGDQNGAGARVPGRLARVAVLGADRIVFSHGAVVVPASVIGLPTSPRGRSLAGAAALDTCPLQQLAVLLLRHPLAALLDDRTHLGTPRERCRPAGIHARRPGTGSCY